MPSGAHAVLDASALLAYLQGEPGSEVVEKALAEGAAISAVNYAEVLSKLSDAGADPTEVDRQLTDRGLVGGLLEILPLSTDDAVGVADLRVTTRGRGLSLGDRAYLATGRRLGLPALTADRAWVGLEVGVSIRQIRPDTHA